MKNTDYQDLGEFSKIQDLDSRGLRISSTIQSHSKRFEVHQTLVYRSNIIRSRCRRKEPRGRCIFYRGEFYRSAGKRQPAHYAPRIDFSSASEKNQINNVIRQGEIKIARASTIFAVLTPLAPGANFRIHERKTANRGVAVSRYDPGSGCSSSFLSSREKIKSRCSGCRSVARGSSLDADRAFFLAAQ